MKNLQDNADKFLVKINRIYHGDNLYYMQDMPNESIDLVYIDPPFGTQSLWHSKAFNHTKNKELAFYDIWGGGRNGYIEFMVERLRHIHRLLKPTGSLFVHLDWRMAHYIKVELDKIFKDNNFLNDIIWVRGDVKGGKAKGNKLARNHDIILFYTKSKNYTFNKPFKKYSKEYIKQRFKHNDNDGRGFYCDQPINGIPEKNFNKVKKR